MIEAAQFATRRRLLQFGAGGYLGLNLGGLWRAQAVAGAAAPGRGLEPIRACILIFYYGGPSHIDTWDLKSPNIGYSRDPVKATALLRLVSNSTKRLPHQTNPASATSSL